MAFLRTGSSVHLKTSPVVLRDFFVRHRATAQLPESDFSPKTRHVSVRDSAPYLVACIAHGTWHVARAGDLRRVPTRGKWSEEPKPMCLEFCDDGRLRDGCPTDVELEEKQTQWWRETRWVSVGASVTWLKTF